MANDQIQDHVQTDFDNNWMHLLQQKDSRLAGRCKVSNVNGNERRFSQIAAGKMRRITLRNGQTIASKGVFANRWVRPEPFDEVSHIDEFDSDALGELPTPQSAHVLQHAMAAKRTMDEIKIRALEGTNFVGKTGTTAVVMPATQLVAVNFVKTGAPVNSGLTLAKLIRSNFILDKNEVEKSRRYIIISALQLDDLLNDVEEVSNADFTNVKALIDGNVTHFTGFEFVMTELLTLDTVTDIRTCIAYHHDGLMFGIGRDRSTFIDRRPDLNNTIQIRTVISYGATRLEEESVVLIFCDESP